MQIATEFVETSTGAGGSLMAFETSHRPVTFIDPTMVLPDPIIQIPVGPVTVLQRGGWVD
jgi:hypothetical protein